MFKHAHLYEFPLRSAQVYEFPSPDAGEEQQDEAGFVSLAWQLVGQGSLPAFGRLHFDPLVRLSCKPQNQLGFADFLVTAGGVPRSSERGVSGSTGVTHPLRSFFAFPSQCPSCVPFRAGCEERQSHPEGRNINALTTYY